MEKDEKTFTSAAEKSQDSANVYLRVPAQLSIIILMSTGLSEPRCLKFK